MGLNFLFPTDEKLEKKINNGKIGKDKNENEIEVNEGEESGRTGNNGNHGTEEVSKENGNETIRTFSIERNRVGIGSGNHGNHQNGGRRPGRRNLLPREREILGFEAHFRTAKQVAEETGASPLQVHFAKHGKTGSNGGNGLLPEVKERIDKRVNDELDKFEARRTKILGETTKKLLGIMGLITVEEVKSNPKEQRIIAGVAKDVATIVEKVEKKAVKKQKNNYTFNVFTPEPMSEEEFGDPITIEAKRIE